MTIATFVVIIAITLGITAWASRRSKDTDHHYVAGGEIKGWQNGLALAGDFMSAATILGIGGLTALGSFTGFYIAAGGLAAFLVMLLLVAEPLRNLGKYTLADALTSRFNAKGVRSAAAISTIAICIPYMIAQLVGAGAVIELLTGVDYAVAVIIIGILMAVYITAGGMLATTYIQVVKAVLLIVAIFVLLVLVLARFSFNPLAVLDEAGAQLGGGAFTPPHGLEGLSWVSVALAYMFGASGLPHILIRFFTVPDAKAARASIAVSIWVIALVLAAMPIIGYGAALLVGQQTLAAEASEGGNLAVPLLAEVLGGPFLLAFVAAVTFATILAVVAGLVIAASGAFAHDFYNNVIRNGEASDGEQLNAARIMAVVVSVLSIVLSLAVQNVNIAILVAVPLVIAASANVPVILLTLYWKRFNTTGAIVGMLTGLVASVGLTLVGPTAMGENALFPLAGPGLVSMPLGFLGCYLGTVLSGTRAREERERGTQVPYEEIHVRSNTGYRSIGEELEREPTSRSRA
ncbi:sodium/solute symporter [Rubrobacter marinus]|uniref:Sodium/solute symporter n=1 Tax=Rubrobacter marinus TaxID=2653852 RepID=A0A6G8Q2B1_9ACTN|nr:sodium/solute symporter [Rubrobacter marinus]